MTQTFIAKSLAPSTIYKHAFKGFDSRRLHHLNKLRHVYEAELSSGEIELTAEGKIIKVSQ